MLSLKIKLADDIRRVSVADSTSYDELCSLVQSLFGLAPNTFSFKYTDEDGDMITISAPCDWTEAAAATRPLTLVVVMSAPSAAAAAAAAPVAVTPTPISASVSEFELLLTSQQQRAADEQAAATPEPLPFLSASVEPAAAAAATDASASDEEATAVNVDELPLADRLEALLVELVYSGEHVIDEVVASLKRSTADLDASSIALSLELFLTPLRESLRSGGTKACGLLADLQEHAQSSMLLARIASVISLAGEALQKHAANVDMTEVSRRVRSFNLREHITSFIHSIENHPQVSLLVSTLKDKLAAAKAAASNNNEQPAAAAAAAVVQEEPRIAARFVTDVTIPDDSQLVRGVPAIKTWRVRNSGNVQWPTGMYLEQGSLRIALPTPMPDEEIDISTELRPADLGLITEYFNLCDPAGTPRLRLWARVHVVDPVVPVVEPAVSAEFTAALEQLQTLGFATDAATAALVATEGNFHEAMDLLCASNNE